MSEQSEPTAAKALVGGFLVALFLCLLFGWIGFYKIQKNLNQPFFTPDGDCFYWTENAFHFRHARMVSEGRQIPAIDTDIQFPEGLDTNRYITAVMERVTGTLHRLFFSEVPLHIFLTYFMSIFSASSVGAVFLAALFLSRSKWVALVSAFFYSIAPATFARSSGATFIREDFALPFIFYSFACFVYCLRKDSPAVAIIGSLLLAIALSAWHLTQFYLLLFIGGLLIVFFFQRTEHLPRRSFTILTVTLLVAAVTLPILRAKQTVLSFPLMLSYGLTIALWLMHYFNVTTRKQRIICLSSAVLLFLAVGFIIQQFIGGHSYIYQFVLAKIRYLGELPEDPSLLPFEIKVTWTSSFVSTPIREFLFLTSSTLLFGLAMLARLTTRILRRKPEPAEILTAYFAFSTVLLFLLITRLSVFAIFFLAVPAGYIVLVKNRLIKVLSAVAIAACVVFAVHIFSHVNFVPFRPPQEYVKDVVDYIRDNSAENEAVLTSFQFGPSIAAYARRPVILHPKFESQAIRDKAKDVYTSLYSNEEDFYQVCKKYKTDLFVYQTSMAVGNAPGSMRYMVGANSLRSDSAAFLFHFAPEKLKYFYLVHQNFGCRIFRVGAKPTAPAADIPYIALYDLSVFCEPESVAEIVSDSMIAEGLRKLDNPRTHKDLGDRFLAAGDFNTAVSEYSLALSMDSRYVEAGWGLGIAAYQLGQKQEALDNLKIALNMAPQMNPSPLTITDASAWITLGNNELAAHRYTRAVRLFHRAVQLDPNSSAAHLRLATAQFGLKKIPEAEKSILNAISCDPKSCEAYENLGKLYASSNRYDKAVEAIEMSLSLKPDQQRLVPVLEQLKRLASSQRPKKDN